MVLLTSVSLLGRFETYADTACASPITAEVTKSASQVTGNRGSGPRIAHSNPRRTAFGRAEIVRMPLPGKTPPRSGRRLFVFPDLAKGGNPTELTKHIVALTDKALVLCQATSQNAESSARALASGDVPVFRKEDVQNGLKTFATAPVGVLGLANRYDGLDLPGSACRIVVLEGKPDAVGLQERFLSERAEASAALSERVRSRVVQGAGRCTRGPNDYAVVVVRGQDITRYFSRPEHLAALESELQAEVQFGWDNSKRRDASEIVQNVRAFLDQDTDWREQGEPLIAEFREGATKIAAPGAAALGASAQPEVEAWQLAFSGDLQAASQTMERAARVVGEGGEATRGYRGLLLYLAGVWLHCGAEHEAQRARSRQLLRDAAAASIRGTWLKEMRDLTGSEQSQLSLADSGAINQISARLTSRFRPDQLKNELAQMRVALNQSSAHQYESALTALGTFLGADAQKPPGTGRCDSAWRWDMGLWMTLEAKSEEQPDGLLPLKDIRQANTQLDQMAADQGVAHAPGGSVSIIVSDRLTADPAHAAVANRNVYLTSTQVVTQIAGDAEAIWAELLTAAVREPHADLRARTQAVLTENGCLPSQVLDRLTQDRIRPGE